MTDQEKRAGLLCLAIVGVPLLIAFLCTALQEWHSFFDDAFITFRYARNLADGYGITWNPGMPPTEGYTNFLLVVVLAPFIRLGLDPLAVSRLLGYIGVVGCAAVLFWAARRDWGASLPVSLMVAAVVLMAPNSRYVPLLGLETAVYAFFLLLAFRAAIEAASHPTIPHAVRFSFILFVATLLRPEALLLYPAMVLGWAWTARRTRHVRWKPQLVGFLALAALCAPYLVWKWLHFGALLPNPFYLKAAGSTWSPLGTASVRKFAKSHWLLLGLALASLLPRVRTQTRGRGEGRTANIIGFGLVAAYVLFFARIDTLMDQWGRFLFPLVPILAYLAIPALLMVFRSIGQWTRGRNSRIAAVCFVFLLVFDPTDVRSLPANLANMKLDTTWRSSDELMAKENRIANSLAGLPDIARTRVAFTDSGVLPYRTQALWLDTVGLNDPFIARSRVKADLVDYYFGWRPDIVIQAADRTSASWITYGHGPLGDYASWLDDARFDAYEYVGTAVTDVYDLYFFVRSSSPESQSIASYLRSRVLDGRYDPLPYPFGTYTPPQDTPSVWTSFMSNSQALQ